MSTSLTVTLGLHCYVELVDKSEAREGDVHALRFIEGDAHVLDEVFNEKSGVEVSFKHARREVIEGPASSGATLDRAEHSFKVQASLGAV